MNEFLENNHPCELDIDEVNIDLLNIVKKQNIKINKIHLYNRYDANIWLQHLDKDLWELKSKDPEDLHYMRFIYEDDHKTIYAVDPSGGPFLSVGLKLNNDMFKIEEIFPNGYIFRLSKIK